MQGVTLVFLFSGHNWLKNETWYLQKIVFGARLEYIASKLENVGQFLQAFIFHPRHPEL